MTGVREGGGVLGVGTTRQDRRRYGGGGGGSDAAGMCMPPILCAGK